MVPNIASMATVMDMTVPRIVQGDFGTFLSLSLCDFFFFFGSAVRWGELILCR